MSLIEIGKRLVEKVGVRKEQGSEENPISLTLRDDKVLNKWEIVSDEDRKDIQRHTTSQPKRRWSL